MIFDAGTLPVPGRMRADLCVIGSGPGGATAAAIAAEAGLKVVVLEAGALVTPAMMSQREEDMLPRLLWHAGARTTRDRAVRIVQGHGVGGSSLHNINLCKRTPAILRRGWAKRQPLERLDDATWDALYAEVEALIAVSPVAPERWNRHNRLLQAGCEALGWRGGGLSHNRTGCLGSGFCEVGCAYDAKNNALKVFVPRIIAAGGQVLANCQAVRVLHVSGRVRGVDAVALDPVTRQPRGTVHVEASRICVAASATGTPALLMRSRVPDPSGTVGRGLRCHPAVLVAGDFGEPVRAWEGIPQTYECTEWLDFEGEGGRTWIVPAFGHPVTVASMRPGDGAEHRRWMTRFAHLGALTAMLHDHTAGTVEPKGDLDVAIDYWPDAADRAELMRGLSRCAKLLFAAGAERVLVPGAPARVLGRGDDVEALAGLPLDKGALDLSAVHPMGTVAMSDDPRRGAVGSDGKHHHVEGLWVADGSLLPGSIGVPPQVTIYALGLHVGRAIAG